MRFIKKNGELKDGKIVAALRKAATWYENGAILETYQLLFAITNDIEEWLAKQEEGDI